MLLLLTPLTVVLKKIDHTLSKLVFENARFRPSMRVVVLMKFRSFSIIYGEPTVAHHLFLFCPVL